MTQEHPITPPPELVKQWWKEAQQADYSDGLPCWLNYVATQAARWGADEQLEMDATWVALQTSNQMSSKRLIAEMRPKPPSLKEQALEALKHAEDGWRPIPADCEIIRRALEQLND